MIIVSQDKKHIINFNQISSISIFSGSKKVNPSIYCRGNNTNISVTIGKYITEEECKEILKEITDLYMDTLRYDHDINNYVEQKIIYYMP